MAGHTGTAMLPLHGGRCPPWLFDRMKRLGAVIVEAMVEEWGPDEVLRRLADPFWFQSLGSVLGYDWHSSGVTTVVCGALKEGLQGRMGELGLFVCGGKGATSRRTPDEIAAHVERHGLLLDPATLVRASRMAAKVDSAVIQDGHQIYHHAFFFTPSGRWCVVQQGMNERTRWARRYHWLSEAVRSFVEEPHAAILGMRQASIPLNMAARESDAARKASVQLAGKDLAWWRRELDRIGRTRELRLPAGHAIERTPQLERALSALYRAEPADYEALVGAAGVGPRTVRALAMVAEIVYGARPSYRDPVRYAFAHGGKDGIPFPVDRELYDRTVAVWKRAVARARLGRRETLEALRRLGEMDRLAPFEAGARRAGPSAGTERGTVG
ncbi:DUF763 domain-containing protein [Carboxydochorda subterranea]|uniref:DUF763 domain-containing protein n=1 Tax=Carboxydichorda subterranea TaxID=3109565 RepID=A0ABZ1BZQ6_9FIRM|nr:DUF763 domain-containing protein [Limnochorda sp. L945t]WRP18257.1 DUF763 domain-containing protein [Limnochorda sp. L945t]